MNSTRIPRTQAPAHTCLIAHHSFVALAARLACVVALFCIMHISSFAQPNWVPTWGNISYTGGPVGINTTAPVDLLHINGTNTGTSWPYAALRFTLTPSSHTSATAQIALAQGTGTFSNIATEGDLVIRTISSTVDAVGTGADDIILSTQTPSGAIRFATWDATASNDLERMTILNTGNVGIGTATPQGTFHVLGNEIIFQGPSNRATEWSAPELQLKEQGVANYWAMMKRGSQWPSNGASDNNALLFTYGDGNPLNWSHNLQLYPNGNAQFFQNVGIGVVPPALGSDRLHVGGKTRIGYAHPTNSTLSYKDYMLAVDGMVVAKEYYCETSDWADFVFEDSYKLPSLTEVEASIQQNRHLPNIPSAAEVREKGINMGEMQAKLLQKVEELTLYVIGLKKENQKLEDEISSLINK